MKELEFRNVFCYKLIYVLRINDVSHKGCLKIGDASIKTNKQVTELSINCRDLNLAAKKRIKEYTNTAATDYELLHTELATYINKDGILKAFRDYDVHRVLTNSNIQKIKINQTSGKEWFRVDLSTAKDAIAAVKNNMANLSNKNVDNRMPIVFRPEQLEAISSTIKCFKNGNTMLWNAKMRFGKTLSALQVINKMQFKKSIIITHRPVVDEGWYEDFNKIFYDNPNYVYGSRKHGNSIKNLEELLVNYVYFASIQDLRESNAVDGKYDKNDEVFKNKWDFVIIDEAHEGTQTQLGINVKNALIGEQTKVLELSGTPFNILDNYDSNIYTWDYMMEQSAKDDWFKNHCGDSNPYEELPKMHMYTYDLNELLGKNNYSEIIDKAFNFKEFFRTWTGDIKTDYVDMPSNQRIGDFVHEDDINNFLNLITKHDDKSLYPFATKEFRNLFRHSFWMIPGVKEGKALSKLLKKHPIFKKFKIINVAGDGDADDKTGEALEAVQTGIKEANLTGSYTITISCGKLTTGVTVKEWTAVFYLAGSYSTSAVNYLQTIFRVQSPCNMNGQIKTDCYVFDFAPDRTLKMVADAVNLSAKAGGNSGDKLSLGRFINFCPIISVQGSGMSNYNVNMMMQQLKRAYADRAIKHGFADTSLYKKTFKLDENDVEMFKDLNAIIGKSAAQPNKKDVVITDSGLDGEEREKLEKIKKEGKNKKELTEEEKALLAKEDDLKKQRRTAITTLQAISIRMPLMIFGTKIPFEEDINLHKFIDIVDDSSWKEFMPWGVDKDIFKKFIKYYDEDVFIAAGRKIRDTIRLSDDMDIEDRIKEIACLHGKFKNPDKETVLTPWRVVNQHMSLTLGGWTFYDKDFLSPLEEPRYVDRRNITNKVFNMESNILEINSKTGLYPLYVTYSIYKQFVINKKKSISIDEKWIIWKKIVENNIYVICKTPMAKQITKRTLLGYKEGKTNSHYFDDMNNQFINKSDQLIIKILSPSFWNLKGKNKMKFNAVVGNPPYQEDAINSSKTNGQARRKSIFPYFQKVSDRISNGSVSLIYPGARWIHRSGKGMNQFGLEQINDLKLEHIDYFANANEIFTDVAIADGISIVYKDVNKTEPGFRYNYYSKGQVQTTWLDNPGNKLISLNPKNGIIIEKVENYVEKNNMSYVHDRVLSQKLFGIESSFAEDNPNKVRILTDNDQIDYSKEIKLLTNDKAGKAGRATWFIVDKDCIQVSREYISKWKVVVSSANAGGQKRDNQISIIDNHSAFGRSRVAIGVFNSKKEAENYLLYSNAKLIKFMYLMTDEALTSLAKIVPDLGDYSDDNKIIDYSKNVDEQLYKLMKISKEEIEYLEDIVDNR